MDYNEIDDSFLGVVVSAISLHVKATDEQLQKVCNTITEIAGGDVVYISKQYSQRLSVRNSEIKRDFSSGLNKQSLQAKYRLSRRQIDRALKT